MHERIIRALVIPCAIAFFPHQVLAEGGPEFANQNREFSPPSINRKAYSPTYKLLYAYDFDPPSLELLDDVIFQDSLHWVLNVYISGSLHDMTLLSGSYSSGNWSARGYYTFSNRALRGRFSGSVIFRFTDGRLRCLEYADADGVCRPSYDQ